MGAVAGLDDVSFADPVLGGAAVEAAGGGGEDDNGEELGPDDIPF